MKQVFEISKDEALKWIAKEFIRQHPELDADKIEVHFEVPLFGEPKFLVKLENPKQRKSPRSPEFTESVLRDNKW